MEKLVSIVQQLPLVERPYTDRQGQQQVFASRGFVLTDGVDTFYAEAVGDTARVMPQFDPAVMHMVQCQLAIRDYDDKNGQKRWLTEVKIVKMV